MKIEVKKIDISSLVFSGFTVALLVLTFLFAIAAIFIVPNPVWMGEAFTAKLLGVFLYTAILFIITLAYMVVACFIYNFFVGIIGMSGIKINLEESETQE